MSNVVSPNVSCMAKAELDKTQLAGCKVALIQGLSSVGPETTLSELQDNECDYSGYTAGGQTIAAWLGPILAPGGGAQIFSPTLLYTWSGSLPGVSNNVTGWYIVLADGVTLWQCGTFDTPITMNGPGAGFVLNLFEQQNN